MDLKLFILINFKLFFYMKEKEKDILSRVFLSLTKITKPMYKYDKYMYI